MKNRGYLILIGFIMVMGLVPLTLFVKGETVPPIVDITSHVNNQTVSGTIVITATASDSGSGIAYLQFYFGGEFISQDSSSPYQSVSIDIDHHSEGANTIAVVAFDKDGNFAVDTVIVNSVINYDTIEYSQIGASEASRWYLLTKYTLWMSNLVVYYVENQIRKITFDAYSPNTNVIFKWHIYDVLDATVNWDVSGNLGILLNSNPTHVTMRFDYGELPSSLVGRHDQVFIQMYKGSIYLLQVMKSVYYVP